MKLVKEFFTWSKGERRALIILSFLLLFLIIGDVFFHRINPIENNSIHPDTLILYQKLLEQMEEEIPLVLHVQKKGIEKKVKEESEELKVHSFFDPNELDQKGWENLGFSPKQSASLLKYKASIQSFKTKKDLANSYVVSESKFNELERFIRIVENENNTELKNVSKDYSNKPIEVHKVENLFLDINSADSISLLKLNGIGPFYAGKIIQYRKELGSYIAKEQLLEIWNFDSLKLQTIGQNIYLDTSYIIKLSINSDSSSVLKKHPYINWNIANAIVNYRIQHGYFKEKEELKKIVLINDSVYSKLYPYISLD